LIASHALLGAWLGRLGCHVSPTHHLATACLVCALKVCIALVVAARSSEWQFAANAQGLYGILPFLLCYMMARLTYRLTRARAWASRSRQDHIETERLLVEAHQRRSQQSRSDTPLILSPSSPLESASPAVEMPAAIQPPHTQDEAAWLDQLQAWRQSVHKVSLRKAKHDVAAQVYAGIRTAARDTTCLLSRLPRDLHKAIAWHVVHKRAEEDASCRIHEMAMRQLRLYPDQHQAIRRGFR